MCLQSNNKLYTNNNCIESNNNAMHMTDKITDDVLKAIIASSDEKVI